MVHVHKVSAGVIGSAQSAIVVKTMKETVMESAVRDTSILLVTKSFLPLTSLSLLLLWMVVFIQSTLHEYYYFHERAESLYLDLKFKITETCYPNFTRPHITTFHRKSYY